ncbi:hypothetical protein HPCPY1124_1691 [Helicobacter pylori CPY1124]|nr:hypothetical protein HPCPY1124_1691 [Helicobacter pylori CPY1124]
MNPLLKATNRGFVSILYICRGFSIISIACKNTKEYKPHTKSHIFSSQSLYYLKLKDR